MKCKKCGYYETSISRCVLEGISLKPESKICIRYLPLLRDVNEHNKE